MAKVSGPLMSMSASGKFGGTLVFGQWKGRPTVRQLIRPANPKSSDQETSRNQIRVAGAGQHFMNLSTQLGDARLASDKESLTAVTPSGQAWNGYLVACMIGAGSLNYTAANTGWTGLDATAKTAWQTAATDVSPAFGNVYQTSEGGVAATAVSPGEAFFHYQWGLYVAGLTTVPGATPPAYV